MGTYDELDIDGITWQTKALGKRLKRYQPGDSVTVECAAGSDDPSDIAGYTYDDPPQRYVVQVRAVEYALVEDGKLVGLASSDDLAELEDDKFDYYGADVHDLVTQSGLFDPARSCRAMTPKPRATRVWMQ